MIIEVESPYTATHEDKDVQSNMVARNIAYARLACHYVMRQGHVPIASHLFFTQPGMLDDRDPAQRKQGIDAGKHVSDILRCPAWFFMDLGWSGGMEHGKRAAERRSRGGADHMRFITMFPQGVLDPATSTCADLQAVARAAGYTHDLFNREGW